MVWLPQKMKVKLENLRWYHQQQHAIATLQNHKISNFLFQSLPEPSGTFSSFPLQRHLHVQKRSCETCPNLRFSESFKTITAGAVWRTRRLSTFCAAPCPFRAPATPKHAQRPSGDLSDCKRLCCLCVTCCMFGSNVRLSIQGASRSSTLHQLCSHCETWTTRRSPRFHTYGASLFHWQLSHHPACPLCTGTPPKQPIALVIQQSSTRSSHIWNE